MKIHAGMISRQSTLAEIVKALVLKNISDDLYNTDQEPEIELEIGNFDNCREYGFTYSIKDSKQDNVFCVYEHRNSDQICINGCAREDVKPYGPYAGETKWDVLFSANYEEYHNVSEKLVQWLMESYRGEFDLTLFKKNPD